VRVGDKTGIARGITDQGALLLDQGGSGGLVELTSGLVQVLESP
jgi:biotin-(acetyl-CoA carboxylase) ligase